MNQEYVLPLVSYRNAARTPVTAIFHHTHFTGLIRPLAHLASINKNNIPTEFGFKDFFEISVPLCSILKH